MDITRIPLVKTLAGDWSSLKINGEVIPDVYPFLSVTDLKRLLWMHHDGETRWAPERVFLGVRGSQGLRPVEFTWPIEVGPIDLPDPHTTKTPNPALVDSTGIRKPIYATMIGGLTLETALSPELLSTGKIPELEAISLDDLHQTDEPVEDSLFGGYYQLYFPWLKTLEVSANLAEAYAATVPYTEDRTARIGIVQACLEANIGGSSVSLDTFVRFKWILPLPMSRPESLEKTFYSIQASPSIPFLRYYPIKGAGAPLLKIGLNPDGSPVISDPKILTQYLSQPAPNSNSAVVVARCPLTSEYAPVGTAFTIHMFEDGTSDVVIEVPQRGMTFLSAIASDAQRVLKTVMTSIGFPEEAIPSLRNIHATYKWIHPNSKKAKPLSGAKLLTRIASLTPFLEAVPQIDGEKAMATFQWRATSNYESESSQFQYITQLVLRGTSFTAQTALESYVKSVQARFGLTESVARATIDSWLEKRGDAVAPVSGSMLAVARHSIGASIAVYSSHPEYRIEIQGVESDTELQRLLSVVAILLGASDTDLRLTPPVSQIQAVATIVALEEAKIAEAVPAPVTGFEDTGDTYDDLLADLGFGGEEAPEEDTAGQDTAGQDTAGEAPEEDVLPIETAPLPDLTAAVAAVEDECGANPIPGSTVLEIAEDWYMSRLKRADPTMFGYPASKLGRTKTYSKSCQRRDDRQPNIMTLMEYARVKNCYQETVRFVDLPPQKLSDLPKDPTYNPNQKYPDDYFLKDPETGKPMWTIYGYENKSRVGEFLYLICAEFWCDYDNLPLLLSEYMGTQGRGFTKKAESCPFCGGGPIKNMNKPAAGESVIVREPKDSTGKIHSFIGTMTRTMHPAGYGLPCCDTTPRLLKHYMSMAVSGKLGLKSQGALEEVVEVPPEEDIDEMEDKEIVFNKTLQSMKTEYVLGNDKILEAGKIGLLPPALQKFFGHQCKVKSQGIKKVFEDNTYGFIRLGVDTKIQRSRRGMNLFAGLAPLLGMNSPEQVLRLFLGNRNPMRLQEPDQFLLQRIVQAFEAANYGTLLIEFAAKSTEVPAQGVLEDFAQRNGYTLGPARAHVTRLYRAWNAFLKYLVEPSRPKHLRHLEHLLAQPGPISPRGIQLIVLEPEGDSVRIVCPTFGIPPSPMFADVPVSFLWHDPHDESWEPIILFNGTKDAVKYFGEQSPELAKLPKSFQSAIMGVIRSWKSLQGCVRPAPPPHVWTPDRDTTALPRLSGLLRKNPSGIVRDRSNRLAGVIVGECFLPCLDDGNLVHGLQHLYEAEMMPSTPWSVYEKVYAGLAAEYKGLRPVALLSKENQIIGFRTEVGSMIPVAPEPLSSSPSLPIDQLDMFPWERDAIVLRSPDLVSSIIPLEETSVSIQEQAEEAYQHLRLSFSRWLTRDPKGPNLRHSIGVILNGSQPLFEKRKRMDLLLQPKIQGFIEESTTGPVTLPLLREDCLTLPEAQCSGACKWSSGRCLIHFPGGSQTVMVMTYRLSDELLRYSRQRREILTDSVATIRTPHGSFRSGNELYLGIKPKDSPEDILSRLGVIGPRALSFPEELTAFEGAEDEVIDLVDESNLGPDWIYKGFTLPTVLEGLEDPRGLTFAGVTNRSLEDWSSLLEKKGQRLDWSPAMLQVISDITQSNLLFVRAPARIETWYQPTPGKIKGLNLYSIFWGPKQLLVSKGSSYRFPINELPGQLLTSLDAANPVVKTVPAAPEPVVIPIPEPVKEATPAEVKPVEEETPAEVKPAEVKPADDKPAEEATPAEVKPADDKPVEEATPADVKPVEVKPVEEETPADVKPAEVKPAEVKPAEVEPVEEETPADVKLAEEAAPVEATVKPVEEAAPVEATVKPIEEGVKPVETTVEPIEEAIEDPEKSNKPVEESEKPKETLLDSVSEFLGFKSKEESPIEEAPLLEG
jgi:hypothetical protein